MILLGSTVQSLMLNPGIRRIECQLLMLNPPPSVPLPFRQFLKRHDRFFMSIDKASIQALRPAAIKMRVGFAAWTEKCKEDAAHLVTAAYRGHVDSEINDQYRTIPGARHFLLNIIQYPGCGRFSPRSSFVAVDESSGRICGMCLSSLVSDRSGHVTQLCVLPGVRGEHIGYELLRLSLLDLVAQGCTDVSLTVTCSNVSAIRLYESLGFRSKSSFPSLVWEGF
jgi:ribosomal protein S18 acetylase RimI-like enzyme